MRNIIKKYINEIFVKNTTNKKITYTVSSVSNFVNSFKIVMYLNNEKIGVFIYFVDPDDYIAHNSVEIYENFKNQGYGKILLLLAIKIANDNEIGFESDISKTIEQDRAYKSLLNNGLIECVLSKCWLTDAGEDYLLNLNINQR